MKNLRVEREKMVETQIAGRGVRDPAVLALAGIQTHDGSRTSRS